MENKVLVEVYVPELEEVYDLYIPIGKTIGNLIFLLVKAISEMTDENYATRQSSYLYNKDTGERYMFDQYIKDTNIRNGSRLILL